MPDAALRNLPPAPATDWMQPLPPAIRLVLHGDAGVRAAAARTWGVPFADAACRAFTHGTRATLWLGPDEYLLLDTDVDAGDAAIAALEHAMGDTPHALVDISHRQFGLEVRGPRAELILGAACPLDLDIAEFPVNMCTRTVLAKADVVLWRTREEAFHLEIWRSFGGYVSGLLGEIAGEFYGE